MLPAAADQNVSSPARRLNSRKANSCKTFMETQNSQQQPKVANKKNFVTKEAPKPKTRQGTLSNPQLDDDHTYIEIIKMAGEVQQKRPGVESRIALSIQQLLMLNSVVCGLEFCASAAFTYIPPMLLKAGIAEKHMSIILGIGPLIGFFLVPVIGKASDNCKSRFGRRRPFILTLGMLLILSLIVIPYGEIIGIYLFGRGPSSKQIGVGMLVLGAILLDFSSQACLTPCEALLADACKNTNQQERCFTVYSFMISVGGCIGYLITALDWNSSQVGIYFGGQEQSAFTLLIFLFIITLVATLGIAQEKPLTSESSPTGTRNGLNTDEINKRLDQIHQAFVREKENFVLGVPNTDAGYETASNQSTTDDYQPLNGKIVANGQEGTESLLSKSQKREQDNPQPMCPKFLTQRQCHIPLTRWTFTSCEGLFHLALLKLYTLLPHTIKALLNIPFVLKRLAIANFCSWTAVMGFNLFFTDFVGQAVYGGNPNGPEDSIERALYDEGVRMGSWGLLFHCITSAIYAAFIDRLVDRYGMMIIYMAGMTSFTCAMAVMVFVRNVYLVNMMAACTGFAYATVTTIPFMLVNNYHESKEIYFFDTADARETSRGIGSDMATVDSAYFLSQVMLSAFMGYLVYYSGTVLAYVVCAGSVGAVAVGCVMRVIYTKQQMSAYIRENKLESMMDL